MRHVRNRGEVFSGVLNGGVAANKSEAIYDNDLEFASDDTL